VEWLVVRSVAEYTAMEFARAGCRVLFVEPFNSLPTLVREAAWQKRKRSTGSGLRSVGDRMWVYRPPPLGIPGGSRWAWPTHLNGRILAHFLKPVLKQLGFDRPVIYTYLYNSASAVKALPAQLSVYECGDEDAAMARSDHQRRLVKQHEENLCRQCDLVLAVTEELAVPRRVFNPHTHEVPCAGDVDFFSKARLPDTLVPADIAALPKPVLGYMGGLDPWKMDVELLTYIATARPDWTIALVGYVWFGFDPAQLTACPNIKVLGSKKYDQFPGYLKGMDVCLMPFPLNDITRNGDALKCYEYLSAGKPVVSSPVPAARRMSAVVEIANTPEEFVTAIERALRSPPESADQRTAAVMSGHTWRHRAKEKLRLIAERLHQKQSNAQSTLVKN
jgi:glycosyltransferase involved in cell wall biosynthesis